MRKACIVIDYSDDATIQVQEILIDHIVGAYLNPYSDITVAGSPFPTATISSSSNLKKKRNLKLKHDYNVLHFSKEI